MRKADSSSAWAPASLSNLGPGFDALGAALTNLGDTVTVRKVEMRGISVRFDPEGVWLGPTDPERNTAAVSALHVARLLGYDAGLEIVIKKGLPAGTGLGSSASSSVAAAVATEYALGGRLDREQMIEAVVTGESATSEQGHADNVLPSLLGGFVMMRSRSPSDYLRLEGWPDLALAVVLPEAEVLTRDARKALPASILLGDAVDHASRLALLVHALHRRDIPGLGRWMMSDDIVIPARRHLWPFLEQVVDAAIEANASGCTVSGSGPAMVACCDVSSGLAQAENIERAMRQACKENGLTGKSSIHRVDNNGARLLTEKGAISWSTGEPVLEGIVSENDAMNKTTPFK
jgi:homoserine kinase